MRKLETQENFVLLKESLSDYYGVAEIYLNQLESLKSEVENFRLAFEPSFTSTLNEFVSDFLVLINQAITTRRTIKFVGD